MRTPFVLFIVVVIAAMAYLGVRLSRNAPINEALRSELTSRDGKLYRTNELAPFTGVMLEKYPDGKLQSRSELKDGQIDGLSEGWLTNGVLQVQEHFVKGVSHGVRTKYHPNGQKLSEANIENGKITGVFRRWHDNGQLAEEVNMRDGNADGPSAAFYPSGFLKAEAELKNGNVVTQKFWKDGEKKADAPKSAKQ